MSFLDVLLILIYFPICLFIGRRIKNKHRHNPLYQKWFMKGLWFKLICGLGFALVYTFYYDYGGDTRTYFRDSLKLIEALGDSPLVFWQVLHHSFNNVSSEALDILYRMAFFDPREYYVVNFTALFTLAGLGSYFSATLLMALFTYWGIWHLFMLLVQKYPRMERQMAFAALFVPSVAFWGSGIGKDSLMLCGIGLILYHVNQIASGKFWQIRSIVIIIAAGYFMFVVKAYILVSLAPAIALWRTLHLRDKISNGFIRALALPVVGVISVFAIIFTLDVLAQYNQMYSVQNFMSTAESMQGWHYVEGANTSEQNGRGSSYTLGDFSDNTSWRSLISIFPAAVNVTFFRPYLWEVENAGMLAQALESLLFLIFTILIIFKAGLFKTYKYITNDSFLLMCVVFAVFFGFAVGFSSYNFGALSRYKIQCVPFYVVALLVIRQKSLAAKRIKRSPRKKASPAADGVNRIPGVIHT